MRRRGSSHAPPVSLFSFQDIMSCVIGVLFFVVMMMATDIVRKTEAAIPGASAGSTVQAMQEEITRLTRQRDDLRRSASRTVEKINLVSSDESEIVAEIKRLNEKLTIMYHTLEQAQGRQAAAAQQAEDKRRQLDKKSDDLRQLGEQVEKMKAALKSVRSVPRIAYIIEESRDNLEPWLVEISAGRIRAAAKDGRTSLVEFEGKTAAVRQEQFLEWAKSQNRRTHYFVLLIKPSGCEQAEKIKKDLKDSSYEIGTDYLPEEWSAFE